MKTIITILIWVFLLFPCILRGETGIASVYNIKSNHGTTTASGIALKDNQVMVAHKYYPLGTIVSIKNLKNSKSTLGLVVDRGPFVKKRIIDLTPGVAQRIDMGLPPHGKNGLSMVKLEVLGKINLNNYMENFEKFFKKTQDIEYDPEQLKQGIAVEGEHTTNKKIAEIIAKHHLAEDPKYYTKLKKVENKKS